MLVKCQLCCSGRIRNPSVMRHVIHHPLSPPNPMQWPYIRTSTELQDVLHPPAQPAKILRSSSSGKFHGLFIEPRDTSYTAHGFSHTFELVFHRQVWSLPLTVFVIWKSPTNAATMTCQLCQLRNPCFFYKDCVRIQHASPYVPGTGYRDQRHWKRAFGKYSAIPNRSDQHSICLLIMRY